jgi:hypothetical protein
LQTVKPLEKPSNGRPEGLSAAVEKQSQGKSLFLGSTLAACSALCNTFF